MEDKEIDKLLKLIKTYRTHDYWTVFGDFVDILAQDINYSVQILMNKDTFISRSEKYDSYTAKEKNNFIDMGILLLQCIKKAKERGRLEDIIGRVFHELNANSKSAGQFFTPPQIATLTGTLTHKDIKDKIRKNGFFTIRDDCCGSGSLLIGVANTLFNMGYNPQEHLFIFAKDTDKRCVNMCYVQLSLYGIAGIVKHEDCLKGISFNKMITPPAIINHWELKLKRT